MPLPRSRISISLLIGIFICQANLISQPLATTADAFPFRHINYINSEHGLRGNDVYGIVQDRRGFMWVMTENGLNRYDGYSFRSWSSGNDEVNRPLGVSESYTGLVDDEKGMLWFSNDEEGFYSFDPVYEKFHNYRNIKPATNSLSDNLANAIAAGDNGVIWVATRAGLDKFDPSTGSFTHFVHIPGDSQTVSPVFIKAILFDDEKTASKKQDHLWLVNYDLTIEKFNVTTGKVTKRFRFPFTFRMFETLSFVISGVNTGMIWLGSNDNGIYGFDVQAEKFIHINTKRECHSARHIDGLYHVLQDHRGNLWTVNDHNEIVYFDRAIQKFYFYKVPLKKARFLDFNPSFFQDKNHKIWVGAENGLVTIDTKQQPFHVCGHIEESDISASGNYFFSVNRIRQGQLLAGAVGLNVLDKKSNTLSPYKLSGNFNNVDVYAIRFIYQDSRDLIWLSGDFGIVSHDPVTQKSRFMRLYDPDWPMVVPNEGFKNIIVDKNGTYWAINKIYGLFKFDPVTGIVRRFIMTEKTDSINAQNFLFGFLDSKNNLYLGRTSGAFVSFNLESLTFKRYFFNKTNSIPRGDESVTGFIESKNGLIWFSTQGKGIGVYDPATGKFKFFTTENGLVNDVVYSLVQDKKGKIWAGTLKGLSCFLPPETPFDEGQKIQFLNYTVSDGLPGNRFIYQAAFCDDDGTLYFGTMGGGIVYFHPDSLIVNETPPPVIITDLSLKNNPVSVGDSTILSRSIEFTREINLSYRQNIISFSFTALNYIAPEKNQFAYMLEGYDENWILTDASKRFASYTNLDPGNYTFKVKAANNDGRWSEEPTELKINISPPFWQTVWFGALVSLAMLALIYSFYRYRIGQVLLLQRIRNKIAADLHDDIGSTLNSISVYSEVAKKDPLRREFALNMIGESSRKIIDSMSDIVWSVNPANDHFDKIIFRMRSLTYNLLKAKKIDCTFKVDESLNELKLPMHTRRNFYLIFKEALTNLVKYSYADRASVSVTGENRQVVLLVRDSGIGFDVFAKHNGNGLNNIRKRADEIKAKLNIESSKEEGTTIELTFKV